jgi:hypothetical protein
MNRSAASYLAALGIVVLLPMALVGCGATPKKAEVWIKRINFIANEDANGGSPFVCHVVITLTPGMKEQILTMDSAAYFNKAEKLEEDRKDVLQIFKFDIIPGRDQLNKRINVKSYMKATGAYVFAKYSAKGNFFGNVGTGTIMTVTFQNNKIKIESAKDKKDKEKKKKKKKKKKK